jgi:PAS domain S-box-containing protein
MIDFLAPMLSTCAQLTWALREQCSRRKAEAALLDRKTRLRSIVQTAVDGIIVVDENGLIEAFNPAAERLFGYSASDAIGTNISRLLPSPSAEEYDNFIHRFLETGTHISGSGCEGIARRKDGTVFPVELTISEFRLAEGRRFTGIVRDITARKQAEAIMAESAALVGFSAAAGQALGQSNNLSEVLRLCAEAAVSHLGVALARIWTLNASEGVLELQARACPLI